MAYTFKHGDRPLDDYTIQRAVGRGGFGEVYYAVSDGGREVALKYLCQNPEVELRGVAHCINLKSPHLVSIFDVKKSAEGDYFIVMEYSSGPSLRDLLVAEPNGLGPQKAAFFLREIAKGLGYLHDRGIVHRDLKPGNVFFDEGYVKIGDYGLSKFISVSRHSAQTASVGTVHYMAPEVGSGNYHRGIDIYALGVILYEMLLGKVPFEGSSMGEVLMKHLTEQPEVDQLPQPFGAVIRKALAKDPQERYQSVYEMVDDLLEVEDVRDSLAGFSVASLHTDIPRGQRDAVDSPAPSPNPAPGWGANAGNVPPRRKHVEMDARQLPPRMSKKISAIEEKVARRMKKLEAKFGPRVPQAKPAGAPVGQPAGNEIELNLSRGEMVQRMLLALAMAIGLGFIVGAITGQQEEGFASAIMMIVGLGGGVALGCRFIAHMAHRGLQPAWVERVSLAAPVAILTGIGVAPYASAYHMRDEYTFGVWLAIAIVAVFTCWRKRLESGRRGELSIHLAIWPGILALISSMATTDGHDSSVTLATGVAIGGTLVVQALAWLFPLSQWLDGKPSTFPSGARKGRGRGRFSQHNASVPIEENNARSFERNAAQQEVEESSSQSTENNEPFYIHPGKERHVMTRVVGLLLTGVALCVMIACLSGVWMEADEVYRLTTRSTVDHFGTATVITQRTWNACHAHDMVAASTAAGACLGLLLLGLRKSARRVTGTFYRDTFRPVLMTMAFTGIGFGVSSLGFLREDAVVTAVIVLVFSSMLLLFAMFARGRRDVCGGHPASNGHCSLEPVGIEGGVDLPKRFLFTRIWGTLLAVASIGLTVGFLIILADGNPSADDAVSFCALIGAMVGLSIFGFRLTSRYRHGGSYREAIRPFLMACCLAGFGTVIGFLIFKDCNRGDGPLIVSLLSVASFVLFVLLMVFRGHGYKERLVGSDQYPEMSQQAIGADNQEAGEAVSLN